jgi:amino acid adenylation domain-containing protein/non-ribosomal peptide synthase protein (TIGR01720 family)
MTIENLEDLYELSPLQQGMLFHTLYAPESGVYFSHVTCILDGDLDAPAFQRACQRVVDRHAVLRTSFHWENLDKPLQAVHRQAKLPVDEHDWRDLTPIEQQARLASYLVEDRARGFVLSEPPLMRLALIRMADQLYHFVWSSHHILLDGWSHSLIFKEVFALYEAFRQGHEPYLAASRPYGDYIEWLQRHDLAEAEAFWRQELSGFSTATPLGVDQAPGSLAGQREEYNEQQLQLTAETTAALQQFARQQQLTMNTLLQAAWALLLNHYSSTDDVVFGSTSAGRPADLDGVETMVGLFINTLPLRVRVAPATPLLAWLKQLLARQADLRQYEYSPLAQVQGWSELPHGLPLFESLLVYENYPLQAAAGQRSGGLELRDIRYTTKTNYPLTLKVSPGPQLLLQFIFDRRFDCGAITRMQGHMQTILESMPGSPARRLVDVPLLTAAERQQLLTAWNATKNGFPQDACFHTLFEAQVARTPDAVAVVFAGRTKDDAQRAPERTNGADSSFIVQPSAFSGFQLTYRELDRRANQLARALQQLGVGADVPVGLCMDRSPELVVGMLGTLKAGGAYVPLDPAYPPARLSFMLEDARVGVLITAKDEERRTKDEGGAQPVVVRPSSFVGQVLDLMADWSIIARQPSINPDSGVTAANLAYVIYTSGSTGHPKGVAVPHAGVGNLADAQIRAFELGPGSRVLQFVSVSFDGAVSDYAMALLSGATLVLAPQAAALLGAGVLDLLHTQTITTMKLPPSLLAALPIAPLPALRTVITAGEPCGAELVARWGQGRQFFNLYGPSEATVCATMAACRADGQRPPIGRPLPNKQIYLLDGHARPVPIGVPGEIHIGGLLARGYLGRPDLTAERFVPNPFLETNDDNDTVDQPVVRRPSSVVRLYKTGDLARYRPDGVLEFLGRIDLQVKLRGFRIELEEIEAVLLQHPNVHECAVVAWEGEAGPKRLVAYIVPADDPEPTQAELRDFLHTRLPSYMLPTAFIPLYALPLNPNGKVDRRALPAPEDVLPAASDSFIGPRTPIEETLAAIWAEVLRRPVGIHDNFFALGGDSILSIQIIARANRAGLRLTPWQIFQHQTIADLAAQARATDNLPIEQGAVTGAVPLTPIQRWFFAQDLPDPQHFNQAVLLEPRQPLDPLLLEQAVQHLIAHHDALRLRFSRNEDGWHQINADVAAQPVLTRFDLGTYSADEQRAAIIAHSGELQTSLDLAAGPLLRVGLFEMGEGRPSRLLIVVHHLAIDGVSWRILLEDLQAVYGQLSRDAAPTLPPKTSAFRQWAKRLVAHAQTLGQELDYWLALPWTRSTRLPLDYPDGANTEASARVVSVALSVEETRALLQDVPAAYRTQINDVLLTALAQAMARWTGARTLLLDLEGHGREALFDDVDLSRTVGWCTSLFPVLLSLEDVDDQPGAALKAVKEQLRRIPNRGVGYGLLRYLSADADVAEALRALPAAEISFNYLGQFDQLLPDSALFGPVQDEIGPARSPQGRRSHQLIVNGFIVEDRLQLEWNYSANVHSRSVIEHLAGDFVAALQALIAHCRAVEAGGYTPSDFPLARLDEHALNQLSELLGASEQADVEDVYPLSPMQQGMLFHSLYAPSSGVYVGQVNCTIQGGLDPAAFERAWQRTVERHPTLRTHFVWQGLDAPLQIVRRRAQIACNRHDWRGLPLGEQRERLAQYLQRDRQRGFAIDRAPLLRLTLIRTAEDAYDVIWTHHHLLLDGWSLSLVFKDVFAYYAMLAHGREIALAPSRPYRDYIAWIQQQDFAGAEAFWRRTLHGFAAPTPLAVDHPPDRAPEPAAGYDEQRLLVAASTTAQLQTLVRRHGLTLNTLVQGAWALLLSRYSGEQDVVFGATVAGRPPDLIGMEGMIGLFINTLPVRVRADPGACAVPWLAQLQAQQVELRQYEYSPLVQVQGWSAVPRGQPLFESLLVFENYPIDAAVWDMTSELVIQDVRATEQTNYPLTLVVVPGGELALGIGYDRRRFDAVVITRMLGHLATLLPGIAAGSDRRLAELPLLTEAEWQELVVARNATSAAYPADRCFHQLFAAQVTRTPDAIALVADETQDEGRRTNPLNSSFVVRRSAFVAHVTYRELDQRANQLARHLSALGVGPDVRVAICVARSFELVVGLLGIFKAGGAFVPLDPAYPAERMAYILDDAQAQVLLVATKDDLGEAGTTVVNRKSKIVNLAADWPTIAETSAAPLDDRVTDDNLAYLIYTSGSTGAPKGVLIPHHGLLNYLVWCLDAYTVRHGRGAPVHASIAADAIFPSLFAPLLAGTSVVLFPETQPLEGLAAALHRAGHFSMIKITPSQLELLNHMLPATDARGGVRTLVVGAEAVRGEVLRFWQMHAPDTILLDEYGPTETVVGCSSYRVTAPLSGAVPIGLPIANMQFYVLDAHMQPVPIGVPGELYIGGEGVAWGYHNRAALTAEKFVPNPFLKADGRRQTAEKGGFSRQPSVFILYKTGDLVRYLDDRLANIEFLGRIDDQVKIRGYRVEPGEVEALLGAHPAVREVVVLARDDGADHKRLVAYVVPTKDQGRKTNDAERDPSSDLRSSSFVSELRAFLKERLPDYMIPASFVLLDAMPLAPHGKIDRKALPQPDGRRPQIESAYVEPQTAVERSIAAIWQAVLGVDQVGIHDNFFELGGHSLHLIQVHGKLQAQLDATPLMIADLFQYPTVGSLAAYLHGAHQPRSFEESQGRADTRRAFLEQQKQRRQGQRVATPPTGDDDDED